MTTLVTNRGAWERNTSGEKSTNIGKTIGDQGTVRVWVEGQQFVFGPGETKTIGDDGIAAKVIAADARLTAADSREGTPKSNASTSNYRW